MAFLLRIGIFLISPSVYQSDEIFQVQEPAHRLAFGNGVVTWEYRVGARSWIVPTIVAGIMKATAWMGSGSFSYTFALAAVMSLLTLTVVWFSFSWCLQHFGLRYALVAGFATTLWYELVYFGSHPFSEVIATCALLPAIYLGSRLDGTSRGLNWDSFWPGLLLGLTLSLRMHLTPAVSVVALWILLKDWKSRLVPLILGAGVPVALFGLVDALTWGRPFHSYVANFSENLVHGVASHYGTLPWYYYFVTLLLHAGPIPILAIYGAYRSPILGWVSLAVLVPHILISHKEYRFIYPVLPLLVTLAAIAVVDLIKLIAEKSSATPFSPQLQVGFASLFFLLCSAGAGSQFPRWHKSTDSLRAFRYLSTTPEICGVAIPHDDWFSTGGYTYLRREIPIFLFSTPSEAAAAASSFNGVVTSAEHPLPVPGYSQNRCWGEVCLYERPGVCDGGHHENEFSEVLKARGE